MSNNAVFDDLLDPAFGEIYCRAWTMEKNKMISCEDGCEEVARTCKRLAAEFVEAYDKACALGGEPDYWDSLDRFAVKRLQEEYPLVKRYELTYSVHLMMDRYMFAKSMEDLGARLNTELDLTNDFNIKILLKKKIDDGEFTMIRTSAKEMEE